MISHEFDDERKRYQDRIDELEQLLVEARATNPAPVMRAADVEAAIAHSSRAGVRQEVAPVIDGQRSLKVAAVIAAAANAAGWVLLACAFVAGASAW